MIDYGLSQYRGSVAPDAVRVQGVEGGKALVACSAQARLALIDARGVALIRPADWRKCRTRMLHLCRLQYDTAAECGANRQRLRLLLGRSVFHARFNVA